MSISTPGLFDLPIEQYHRQPCDGPSFSKSALLTILAECPRLYWTFSPLNPKHLPQPAETAAQREGRLIGAWILGDKAFSKEFVVSPHDAFTTKEARAWRDDQTRTVIKKADLELAEAMKAALLADEDVAYAFTTEHLVEQTIAWKETHTGLGLWLLSRPDMVPTSPGDLIKDYKRFASIHPDRLQYAWEDFGGDMQAAMALDGWEAVTGEKRPGFANIVQMPKPPFMAQMMVFTDAQIEYGRLRYRAALDIAARCLESGHWPKYVQGPDYYRTPFRVQKAMEEGYAPEQSAGNGGGENADPGRYLAA